MCQTSLEQHVVNLLKKNEKTKHSLVEFIRFDNNTYKFFFCEEGTGMWSEVTDNYVVATIYHYAIKRTLPISTRGVTSSSMYRAIVSVARNYPSFAMICNSSPPNVYIDANNPNNHYFYFTNGLWCFEEKRFINKVPQQYLILEKYSCGYDFIQGMTSVYDHMRDSLMCGVFNNKESLNLFLTIIVEHMRNRFSNPAGHLILLAGNGSCQLIELLQLVFHNRCQSMTNVCNRGLKYDTMLVFSSLSLNFEDYKELTDYCLKMGRLVVLRVRKRPDNCETILYFHTNEMLILTTDRFPNISNDTILRRRMFFEILANHGTYNDTPLGVVLSNNLCYAPNKVECITAILKNIRRTYDNREFNDPELKTTLSGFLSNSLCDCYVTATDDVVFNYILKINNLSKK